MGNLIFFFFLFIVGVAVFLGVGGECPFFLPFWLGAGGWFFSVVGIQFGWWGGFPNSVPPKFGWSFSGTVPTCLVNGLTAWGFGGCLGGVGGLFLLFRFWGVGWKGVVGGLGGMGCFRMGVGFFLFCFSCWFFWGGFVLNLTCFGGVGLGFS